MFLRTLLDVQLQPENLYERVRSTWERSVPFIGKPLPAGTGFLTTDQGVVSIRVPLVEDDEE